MSTRLLSPEDIYDVYGLEALLGVSLEPDERTIVSLRLGEIRDAYVHAAKNRIKAEAKFLGISDVENLSFATILSRIKEQVGKAVENAMFAQAERMQRGGAPNIFGEILKAHQAAGSVPAGVDLARFGIKNEPPKPRPEVDPNWFMKGNSGRATEDPKWAEITRAYLAVESAKTDREITQAIDALNQLQHNSFHVLIDLQTGRMLTDYSNATDDREARKRLQEVLDIKLKSRSVLKFADKMSGDVRGLLTKYRTEVG